MYVVPGLSRALHLTAIPGLSLHTCGDKSIFSQRESQRLQIVLQSDTMYRRESGVTPTRHSGEHSSLFREHDNYFINFSNKFLNNPGSVRQLTGFLLQKLSSCSVLSGQTLLLRSGIFMIFCSTRWEVQTSPTSLKHKKSTRTIY